MDIAKEQLPAISLIFEKANGNILCDYDETEVVESGLADIAAEDLAQSIIDELNNENDNPEFRSTAYWVLSKRYDKKLIPLFKKWLTFEIESVNPSAVYQILIALDNLEEPIFGKDRNGSYSVQESDLNLRDAKYYLQNHA